MAWYDEAVFYHIYPLGLAGGPIEGTLGLFAKYWKQLSVLFGLVVGYIVAVCMGMVDFSALSGTSVIALPHIMPFKPEFN